MNPSTFGLFEDAFPEKASVPNRLCEPLNIYEPALDQEFVMNLHQLLTQQLPHASTDRRPDTRLIERRTNRTKLRVLRRSLYESEIL